MVVRLEELKADMIEVIFITQTRAALVHCVTIG